MPDPSDTTGTRPALISAGLFLFGRKGFEGTSTRAIAAQAGTNVASIAYHFGGKGGLRLACAEAVAAQVSGVLAPFDSDPFPESPDAAEAEIRATLRAFVGLVAGSPEARDFVGFVLRELAEPGEVADLLFERVILPRHRRFCALWSIATGEPAEAETVKLSVFAVIGQVVYFRLAQTFVARRMGWEAIGPAETERIADVLIENLHASLERNRG